MSRYSRKTYLVNLVWTIAAVVFCSAFSVIKVQTHFPLSMVIVPFVIALIVNTFMYFAIALSWPFLVWYANLTAVIGYLLVLAVFGAIAFWLAGFTGWIAFPAIEFGSSMVGFLIGFVDVILDPIKRPVFDRIVLQTRGW